MAYWFLVVFLLFLLLLFELIHVHVDNQKVESIEFLSVPQL